MEITGKRYANNDWRKLLSTRRGTTIVAVVCTLIAAGILVFALHRYRQNVTASGQPETVLVASQVIPKGTSGTAIAAGDLFRPTQIIAKQVSSGAITDTAAIQGKVTTVQIYPGQQITLADFAASGDLATTLGPDERAVSVPLAGSPGLVGQLQAGDHVDVYATYFVIDANGRTDPYTRLLVPNVIVVKPGTATSGGLGGSATGTSLSDVVLKVPATDVAKLAFTAGGTSGSTGNGALWLALRSANAAEPDPNEVLSIQSVLFGSKPLTAGSGK